MISIGYSHRRRCHAMTYAADRPDPVGRMESVEEGIGHTDQSDHCLAGKPCHYSVDRCMDLELRHLGQTGSQWVAAEDESLVDSLVLARLEVDLADHRPEWPPLEHGSAPLPVCAGSLPPSCAPSTPCGSL